MSRPLLILLFCLAAGAFQNRAKISHWLHPPPPRPAGTEQVVLYATTWCGYCAKTRQFFADNHIAYQELDVEKSEAGRLEYEKLGAGGIPIVVVNKATVIHGYNPDAILQAVDGTPIR